MTESNTCPESIRSAASASVDTRRATLSKAERLHSKKLIDDLFGGGHSKAMSAFPIRLVFMPAPEGESSQMLISVPKRYFHRANKRNRVKRQLREAYRLNKHLIDGQNWLMARQRTARQSGCEQVHGHPAHPAARALPQRKEGVDTPWLS